MKSFWTGVVITGLLALTGCGASSTTGGGGTAGGTFKFTDIPRTNTTVKHGGSETVTLKIDKDSAFKEDVKLSTTVTGKNNTEAKGVTAEVDPSMWKASGPAEVKVTIKASDEAAAGEYDVKVTGTPTKGIPVAAIIGVKVPEKKYPL